MPHTPGPWQLAANENVTFIVARRIAFEEKSSVAAVRRLAKRLADPSLAVVTSFVSDPSIPLAEAVANARLIAAAPDLLEALQTLEIAAQADGWPEGWGLLRDKARAAIAKAEIA